MKIIHTESSCGWGGQEIRILSESRGMMARGYDVEILCVKKSRIYKVAEEYQIPVNALEIERKTLRGIFVAWRWLIDNDADILNTHSSTDSWLFSLAMLLVRKKTPIIRTRHLSTNINNKWSTRWLYQSSARHIVVTGERLRHQLITENRFNPKTITSVPTGIDTSKFVPKKHVRRDLLGLENQYTYIGILATLRDWKGHEDLFLAINIMKRSIKGLRCLIVGDGPYLDKLKKFAADLSLEEDIIWAGYQPEPVKWLQAMDVFVLPSWGDEGISQALMQAMSCGLPVVCTLVGSHGEIVDHEETGLIVRKRSPEDLAAALRRIITDEILAEKLSANARQIAIEKCDIELMLDRMENLFKRFNGRRD